MFQPKCVDLAKAGCGEGVLWDEGRGYVWWVDIAGHSLHRFDPLLSRATRYAMPFLVSALAHGPDETLLIATAQGIGQIADPIKDPQTITILHNPEPHLDNNRLNDMAVAPNGDLWAGTMNEAGVAKAGTLYHYSHSGCAIKMPHTTISNGIDWSLDGKRLFFIDSVPGILYVLEDDAWSVFYDFSGIKGKPDGLTVDSQGTIWVAMCEGGCVLGISPEGEVKRKIRLPCDIVTNCAFGGADLKTLFVTTGTYTLSEAEKQANPIAGGLFAVQMDVPGRLPHRATQPGSRSFTR